MDLAKAVLQGTFAQEDGPLDTITKQELVAFHVSLEKAINSRSSLSSPESIECVSWIISNVIPSIDRTSALGKYLVKFINSQGNNPSNEIAQVTYSNAQDPRRKENEDNDVRGGVFQWYPSSDKSSPTNATFNALYILDIFNAVIKCLCAAPTDVSTPLGQFADHMKPYIVDMIKIGAPELGKCHLECHRHVSHLIRGWGDVEIFDDVDYLDIRRVARNAYRRWLRWLKSSHVKTFEALHLDTKVSRSICDRPEYHGDNEDAWHRLPAAAMIPHIKGHRPIPISKIKAVQLSGADVDPRLLEHVSDLVKKGDNIYGLSKRSPYWDDERGTVTTGELNGLGFRVRRDPRTGQKRPTETYYGHSVEFILRMKKRKIDQKPRSIKRDQSPFIPNRDGNSPRPSQQYQSPQPIQIPAPLPPLSQIPSQGFVPIPPIVFQPDLSAPPPPPFNWQGPWPPIPPAPDIMARMMASGLPIPPPPPPPPRVPDTNQVDPRTFYPTNK